MQPTCSWIASFPVLLAAGLITGEALMGVLVSVVAVLLVNAGRSLPLFPLPTLIAGALGTIALILVIVYQYRRTMNSA